MAKSPDLSGSVSKNRFRIELLWGIEKLLECLDKGIEDFSIVFDYQCDIELHLDSGYEFYQVKTSAAKNFGVSWACKTPKSGVSVIGRLYELHDIQDGGTVRLVIVGNKPFKFTGDILCNPGELLFASLPEKDKEKIKQSIQKHIPDTTPDFEKVSYILVAMDLSNPEDGIRGHLVRTYEQTMGCEVRKPNALYNALCGLVRTKACAENVQGTYEGVISNKAITGNEVAYLFNRYADKESSQYDFVMNWIKKQPPLRQSDLKCAYESIMSNIYAPRGRKPVDAAVQILGILDKDLSEEELLVQVEDKLESVCDIEITPDMQKIYAVLALHETMEKGL